mgnify:CR=1 FL=1
MTIGAPNKEVTALIGSSTGEKASLATRSHKVVTKAPIKIVAGIRILLSEVPRVSRAR